MRYLLDTNVLLRLVVVEDPEHQKVLEAVTRLTSEGHEIACTAQSLREIWHVGTRAVSANGIGRTPAEIKKLIEEILRRCVLLTEDETTFGRWLGLVSADGIRGAACHDANHAAVAMANGVDCVVTFDISHFKRFKSSGVKAVRPEDV